MSKKEKPEEKEEVESAPAPAPAARKSERGYIVVDRGGQLFELVETKKKETIDGKEVEVVETSEVIYHPEVKPAKKRAVYKLLFESPSAATEVTLTQEADSVSEALAAVFIKLASDKALASQVGARELMSVSFFRWL